MISGTQSAASNRKTFKSSTELVKSRFVSSRRLLEDTNISESSFDGAMCCPEGKHDYCLKKDNASRCVCRSCETNCSDSDESDVNPCIPCTSSCPLGTYILGECRENLTFAPSKCHPCKTECDVGHLDGVCYGNSTYDTVSCVSCTCSPGSYISQPCEGHSGAVCQPCTTTCPDGQYLQGRCPGNTSYDVVSCEQCTFNCSEGHYLSGNCTSGDLRYDAVTCMPCTESCSEGKFLNGNCSGHEYYDAVTCTECTSSCPVGFFLNGTCKGTELRYDAVTCERCTTTCPAGYSPLGGCA